MEDKTLNRYFKSVWTEDNIDGVSV